MEVTRKVVSRNIEEDEENISRRIITMTARFSMNENTALRKKIKTCNEEAVVVNFKKGII